MNALLISKLKITSYGIFTSVPLDHICTETTNFEEIRRFFVCMLKIIRGTPCGATRGALYLLLLHISGVLNFANLCYGCITFSVVRLSCILYNIIEIFDATLANLRTKPPCTPVS